MDSITIHIDEELESLDIRKQDNQQDLTKHIQNVHTIQKILPNVFGKMDDSHCHCSEDIKESILTY